MFEILFPKNHPYHHPFPKIESLRKIDRKQIYDFYQTYYRPNNSHLIVVGNLNFRELVRKVSHYFNMWQMGEIKSPYFTPIEPHDKEVIYFVDSPNIKRPFICLGNSFTKENEEDFFPLIVLNQILGGTATSRLFMNLRETKEYAFDANSYLSFFKQGGIYTLEAEVKPEVVKESIYECISELKKITQQSIPIFELEQAKYYLIGNFPLQLDSLEGVAKYLAQKNVFGFSEKIWNAYQKNIMMVDQKRISSSAKRYFSHFPAIVVVGNRKKILEPLLDFDIIELYDADGNLKYKIEKRIEEK